MSSILKVTVTQGTNPKRFHMDFSESFGSEYHVIGNRLYPVISDHMRFQIMNLRVAYDIRVKQRHISFIRHNYVPFDRTVSTIIEEVTSFMAPPLRSTLVYMPR